MVISLSDTVVVRGMDLTESVYTFSLSGHHLRDGSVRHQRHCSSPDPSHCRAPAATGRQAGRQKLADHFGVSRTLVRQALFRLSQNQLIRLEPARGAFVAAPSVTEARQVFAGLVVIGAMAMLMDELFSAIEKHTTAWAHRGSRGG